MKSVILKGQEIKIGSKIRFIDDKNLYVGAKSNIIKPQIGVVYTVRGFTSVGGFYLEEIKNQQIEWLDVAGRVEDKSEPGFAVYRFEPASPLRKEKSEKIVKIKIEPIIEERIDKEIVRKNKLVFN